MLVLTEDNGVAGFVDCFACMHDDFAYNPSIPMWFHLPW
jgi:hypothetical protein